MNLHQKLLKIANLAGVLQKNKNGYNYKYVEEHEIQAKITTGMQKYGVMLYPSLVPGSLVVQPYQYQKLKPKKDKNGTMVDNYIPVNEVIVHAEVVYTWVDAENPEDKIECNWAYIGQMEDASQAFGAGATYGNRYYLLKALQLATIEDDPDVYRSKKKRIEELETKEELDKIINEIIDLGTELISIGIAKETFMDIVAKYNKGNSNPASIKSIAVAEAVVKDMMGLKNNGGK